MSEFNGLGLHLGNLPLLSKAKTRSISAENFTGEKGKGGMATEGTGASAGSGPGPRLEGLAVDLTSRRGTTVDAGRDRGARRDPAHLDDVHPQPLARAGAADLLGRRGDAVRRDAARRLLLQRLVRALHMSVAAHRRQP